MGDRVSRDDEKALTVDELIAALQALPPEVRALPVHCLGEAGYTSTPVLGIAEVNADRVMLDGW